MISEIKKLKSVGWNGSLMFEVTIDIHNSGEVLYTLRSPMLNVDAQSANKKFVFDKAREAVNGLLVTLDELEKRA